MSDTVLSTQHGDWVEITLNRPDKLNSFNEEMHIALRAAIADAKDGGARALLLTGAGRGFCAGQDLGDRNPNDPEAMTDVGRAVRLFYNPLAKQLRDLRFPVVCAVNGVAAGAGASVALACDIVLAGQSAKFIQSFSKVGLIPDTGASWHLTRLLGEARAKALALTATPVTADQAAQWGLIWQTVADDVLMDQARELAAQLAAGPTLGLGLAKQAIQQSSGNTLTAHLDLEESYMTICGNSHDYAEGVKSFLEKRPAKFLGR